MNLETAQAARLDAWSKRSLAEIEHGRNSPEWKQADAAFWDAEDDFRTAFLATPTAAPIAPSHPYHPINPPAPSQ